MYMWTLPSLTLLLFFLNGGAHCAELRIHNASEFIQFSTRVSSGTNFLETTVFLDADIDFSGEVLSPVGDQSKNFRGVFDGQGYAIRNLVMASSLQYTGLFSLL